MRGLDSGCIIKEVTILPKTKSELVKDYIEKQIMNGTYQAGDKLPSEAKLCEILGVSRVSVRTAVEKLIAIGLLSKKQKGSTYVSKQNQDNYLNYLVPTLVHNINYLEMLELRQALDSLAIQLCIEHLNDEAIEAFQKLLIEMKKYQDDESFFKLDRKFHSLIAKYSQNGLLVNINETLWEVLEKAGRDSYHVISNEQRIHEHQEIITALIRKDKELAKIYSVRHLQRTINEIKKNNSN